MEYHKIYNILFILSILTVSSIATEQNWAVIDGGSSGSRLFIYKVYDNGTSLEVCNEKGDAKFAEVLKGTDDKQVKNYLEVINDLKNKCNKDGQKVNITGYKFQKLLVLSTAGSRDVIDELADKTHYANQLEKLKTQLRNSFGVKAEESQVVVVSGRQEGIYGFLAYYLQLISDDKIPKKICGDNKDAITCLRETVYYEVGGSSTQIAFTTLYDKKRKSKMLIRMKGIVEFPESLQSVAQEIYSRSFLGNGQNRIRDDINNNADCVTQIDVNANKYNNDNKNNETIKQQGRKRFDNCSRLIQQKVLRDKTLPAPGQEYKKQFKEIRKYIKYAEKQQKKYAYYFNSGGAYFSALPGQSKKEKFYVYPNVSNFTNEFKYLCYRKASNGNDQPNCLALTLPLYFAQKLGLESKKFILSNLSWTQGAIYLARLTKQNYAEPFTYQNTDDVENQKIQKNYYGKTRFQLKKQKHHLK